MEVAAALHTVAESFNVPKVTATEALSTPQRHTTVVCTITKDKTLTVGQHVNVMQLFQEHIAIADSYLAIEDDETCAAYILLELERH